MKKRKIAGILFLILMLTDFFLFIFTVIQPLVFWFITILCAIAAYWAVPKIKD